MKNTGKLVLALGLTCLMIAGNARASDIVLNFDDISNTPDAVFFGGNYGGLNWGAGNEWSVVNENFYMSGYGNTYGSPSGLYSAFNANGVLSVSTTSGSLINFIGAQFSAWALFDSTWIFGSETITVEGYNNNVLVGSASMNLSTTSYTLLNANLMGVDRLDFISDGDSRWWLMDNFTYQVAVPVPAGYISAGVGGFLLMAFGMYRKRRVVRA